MMATTATATAEFASSPSTQAVTATANPKASLMDAGEDILFGSIAGVAGKYIEYPFDTVKVRLQSQPDHLPLRYTGPLDCFRQSLRTEGALGLYRGISAPLVGAALETSSLFFWESVGREWLSKTGAYRRDEALPLSALWLTGAFSGAFTSLVLTPVELVKCKIQVPAHAAGLKIKAPTVTSVIREVWTHQGLRGFWNGQLGTLIRETGGCAAWFGSKETTTLFFRKLNARSSPSQIPSDEPLPLYQQALAGASAGMSYNFLFFPADTIKSRMQTVSSTSTAKKVSFMEVGKGIWETSGMRGLYRGCGITVMRSAPSSAFIFIIFDWLKGRFHQS